jgi:tetratricopeptide (TPR) repeat protein
MASKGKKKKPQPARAVPAGELIKLAEERLQAGRPEEAIRLLQEVEDQLRRSAVPAAAKGRPASGGKGPPPAPALPPHLAALQPRVAPLLARAYFERALAVPDVSQQIADLESAVKRAPTEPRYHLGLGAGRLALGQPEPAFESIRQAHELAPDDPLVDRVFALGLLATGHTREVKEWLKRPKASLDAPE